MSDQKNSSAFIPGTIQSALNQNRFAVLFEEVARLERKQTRFMVKWVLSGELFRSFFSRWMVLRDFRTYTWE